MTVAARIPTPDAANRQRVRTAALRALRSSRSVLDQKVLARIAGCDLQTARDALTTLHAQGHLVRDGDRFSLSERGKAGPAA